MATPAGGFVPHLGGLFSCSPRGSGLGSSYFSSRPASTNPVTSAANLPNNQPYMTGYRRLSPVDIVDIMTDESHSVPSTLNWNRKRQRDWVQNSPLRKRALELLNEPVESIADLKELSDTVNDFPDSMEPRCHGDGDCDELSELGTGSGKLTLWQFLLELLISNKHADIIRWTNNQGEFILLQAESVAKLWGMRKDRNHRMNYDKLSRALRYYYEKNIIRKVHGHKFVYQFIELKKLLKFCQNPSSEVLPTHISSLDENDRYQSPGPLKSEGGASDHTSNSISSSSHDVEAECHPVTKQPCGIEQTVLKDNIKPNSTLGRISPLCKDIGRLENPLIDLANKIKDSPLFNSHLSPPDSRKCANIHSGHPLPPFQSPNPFSLNACPPNGPLTSDDLDRLTNMLRSFTSATTFEQWYSQHTVGNNSSTHAPSSIPSATDSYYSSAVCSSSNTNIDRPDSKWFPFSSLSGNPYTIGQGHPPLPFTSSGSASIPFASISPTPLTTSSVYPSPPVSTSPSRFSIPSWLQAISDAPSSRMPHSQLDEHIRSRRCKPTISSINPDDSHQPFRPPSPNCRCSCHRKVNRDSLNTNHPNGFQSLLGLSSVRIEPETSMSATTTSNQPTGSASSKSRGLLCSETGSDPVNFSLTQLHHQRHTINMQRLNEQLSRMNRSSSVWSSRSTSDIDKIIGNPTYHSKIGSIPRSDGNAGDSHPEKNVRSIEDSIGLNQPSQQQQHHYQQEQPSPVPGHDSRSNGDSCVWMPVPVAMLTSWLNLLSTCRPSLDGQHQHYGAGDLNLRTSPSVLKREHMEETSR